MQKTTSQTIVYYAVFLTVGAVIASLGPTLPALAENVNVNIAAMGFIFTARSFGYLLGALLGGNFYDRLSGHRIIAAFLSLAAILLFFVPSIHILALLAFFIFLVGFTQGGVDVGANTLIIRAHKENPARYLNTMYFFAGVGSFLAPLYLSRTSLEWGYRGLGLAMLPVVLWLLFVPSPSIPAKQDEQSAKLTDYKAFIAFIALAFIIIGSEVSYGGWIFTYFTTSNLGAETVAFSLTSAFWLSITVGRLLSIYLVSRFKAQTVITAYLIGAISSAAILLIFHASLPAIWIGSVGMGISAAALFPTLFAFIQQRIQITGKLAGIVWAFGSLGAMFLPWLIGQLMDSIAPIAMMAVLLTIWSAALIIFLTALRTRPKPASVK